MNDLFHKIRTTPSQLGQRISELRAELRQVKPEALAARSGAVYAGTSQEAGSFQLPLWGQDISVTYPDFVGSDQATGKELGVFDQTLLAYYFTISDGAPLSDQWISFFELPDGKFYAQAFQGYTGHELAKVFGNDGDGFAEVAGTLAGRKETLGDQAFAFQVLPYVAVMAVCWLGDEDFPPSYRILFDSAVTHHLSTDACAILGSNLCRRLIKAYQASDRQTVPAR